MRARDRRGRWIAHSTVQSNGGARGASRPRRGLAPEMPCGVLRAVRTTARVRLRSWAPNLLAPQEPRPGRTPRARPAPAARDAKGRARLWRTLGFRSALPRPLPSLTAGCMAWPNASSVPSFSIATDRGPTAADPAVKHEAKRSSRRWRDLLETHRPTAGRRPPVRRSLSRRARGGRRGPVRQPGCGPLPSSTWPGSTQPGSTQPGAAPAA